MSTPDRLFKIVFVGNSSVGKTSFLSRFCDGSFSPGSAATVGEFSALGWTPAHLWEGAAVRRVRREGLGAPWEGPRAGLVGEAPLCLVLHGDGTTNGSCAQDEGL